jgi:hypothetical protein
VPTGLLRVTSEKLTVQHGENLRKNSLYNYKSAALSGGITGAEYSDSLPFGDWRCANFAAASLYAVFQLLTFWPICKESLIEVFVRCV